MWKRSSEIARMIESIKFLLKYHSVENKFFAVVLLSADNMKTRQVWSHVFRRKVILIS